MWWGDHFVRIPAAGFKQNVTLQLIVIKHQLFSSWARPKDFPAVIATDYEWLLLITVIEDSMVLL